MKTSTYYIGFILLALSLFSCKKFLDEPPLHALVEENAITNLPTAKAAVGGIYATFENDDWAGGLFAAYSTKAGFVNYGILDYELSYTESNNPSVGLWSAFYKSMNAANFSIKGIGALSAKQIGDNEKNELIAQAKCLRAWINANILWAYGHWWAEDADPYGILYRDEPISLSNVQQKRISVGESYKKMYEDLDFAIANLNDFSSSRYVSKQFAKVLKAKLLLYRGGYRNTTEDLKEALTLVNDVLNNHPGSFALEEDMNNVYKNSWDSKECLFARYLENDGNRASTGGYTYTYYLCQIAGNTLPLPPGGTLTASLIYGVDWFNQDPRWEVATGPVRAAESWDNTMRYTFKKLARLGQYAGRQSSDPNAQKYAAYFFRYSELYLMKAELLARTGASIMEAIAPINEMRAKRTAQNFSMLSPGSQSELMDLIFKEIFLENFMENGSEFFASVRFQHNGKPWIETIKEFPLELNKMCWPIPQSEITNNHLMEQNPDEK